VIWRRLRAIESAFVARAATGLMKFNDVRQNTRTELLANSFTPSIDRRYSDRVLTPQVRWRMVLRKEKLK